MFYQIDTRFGLTFSDVQREFPQTSFAIGEDIYGFEGVTPYRPSEIPTYDPVRQGVREVAPVLNLQQWEVYDLEPAQVEANLEARWQSVRSERDQKLFASDWTQLPDAPVADREAWIAYRQALRDVTNQSDPTAIVWPVPPTGGD